MTSLHKAPSATQNTERISALWRCGSYEFPDPLNDEFKWPPRRSIPAQAR
ncbi:hypothetical protein ACFPFV_12675 [Salinicoccus siamensis]